ncbi:ABC transporter ATP-binding protein [Bosea sp. BK604]|uniref:ABC transporter ATP-binding protein n=1 Tax=Bosea sp. BK604 TaxID=2512180 RepID=UPI00104FA318|nr:ABC transporter ATP-binding protein [Bosea sp. BK604]TCR63162.1 peptide/nickel transport system ATP-binding protein/oligopeptide transport system ATP-binding protein [Bosea sp. BK604]
MLAYPNNADAVPATVTDAEGRADAAATPPLLRVQDLRVEFATDRGRIIAVDDVSFTLRPAQTVGIVGESGCGKSVTSLAIMGLLAAGTGRVASGEIMLRRRSGAWSDLVKLPRTQLPDIRGDEIAMIFQEPMTSLNPLHTVGDQIAEAVFLHRGAGRAEALERAAEMLARVGIPQPRQRLGAYPHELSGGMRQRVMIAMALSCEPSILIADEPTTALDVTIQAQIIELFRSLQDSSQMATLFITHDLGVIAEVAHRVLVMYAGQVVEEGSVVEILKRPKHPYTRGLIASVPRLDRPERGQARFFTIPGQIPEPGRRPPACRFMPRCAHAEVGICDAAPPPLEALPDGGSIRCVKWRSIETAPHA